MDIEQIYHEESGRILATLIRLLGDFDLAEEAMQEAFALAVEQWPKQGVPGNPRAWLVSTARNRAVDGLRRRISFEKKQDELQRLIEARSVLAAQDEVMIDGDPMSDDRLRLIFTCCHPALRVEAQVALTLRTLCGLTTEAIAKAFIAPVPTMAQRIVRAKQKIRDARIPYRVPPKEDLQERLTAVMLVVYLVFNEGYSAASGEALIRRDLCAEGIRLGRLLCELLPKESEVRGLLALMLLHDSRRDTRVTDNGEIVLLEEQDRSRWNQESIREGTALAESALGALPGPYSVQAAIAAVHANTAKAEDTDWRQIAALYEILQRLQPTPVVELNRAVAVAMADGPAAGLRLLDKLEAKEELNGYYLLPAARADFLRRLNRWADCAAAYRQALALVSNEAERRFLEKRLAEAEGKPGVGSSL